MFVYMTSFKAINTIVVLVHPEAVEYALLVMFFAYGVLRIGMASREAE